VSMTCSKGAMGTTRVVLLKGFLVINAIGTTKTFGGYSCSWRIQSNYDPCHQSSHSLNNKSSQKNQFNIQNVAPLMVILVTCLETTITWPYTFRLYLKDKPIRNWSEEKTNIVGNQMCFFFFTSTLTNKLYASCGSNHSPSIEKQASLVQKVWWWKKWWWKKWCGWQVQVQR